MRLDLGVLAAWHRDSSMLLLPYGMTTKAYPCATVFYEALEVKRDMHYSWLSRVAYTGGLKIVGGALQIAGCILTMTGIGAPLGGILMTAGLVASLVGAAVSIISRKGFRNAVSSGWQWLKSKFA